MIAPRNALDCQPTIDRGLNVKVVDDRILRDVQFLVEMADGDAAAFREFYDRYSRPLFSIALRILGCRMEAEEALQDAFLTVWAKASFYRPERGAPFSWLAGIVQHRSIDRLRRRSLRALRTSEAFEETKINEGAEDPFRASIKLERNGRLRLALEALSDQERSFIEMTFFRGLTQAEIARSLNVPLGTVKSRIRRGLQKLQLLFSGVHADRTASTASLVRFIDRFPITHFRAERSN